MPIKKYTILQEYVYDVPELNYPIKARIEKCDTGEPPFRWVISHYYSANTTAKPYCPSARDFSTQKEAEESLDMYSKSFTAIGVTPTNQY